MTDKKRCEIDILMPHCEDCGKELKIVQNGVYIIIGKSDLNKMTGDLWRCKCGKYLITV